MLMAKAERRIEQYFLKPLRQQSRTEDLRKMRDGKKSPFLTDTENHGIVPGSALLSAPRHKAGTRFIFERSRTRILWFLSTGNQLGLLIRYIKKF